MHHSLVSRKITPLYFSIQILFTFVPKIPLKCKFLWLLSTRVQNAKVLMWYLNIFSAANHNPLCCFHYMLWWKSALKCKFLRFSSSMSKILQTPHVTLISQVNPLSNLSSFFSVITHNSSVIFSVYIFHSGQKDPFKVLVSTLLKCSGENLPYFSCHFPNRESIFCIFQR